MGRRQEKCIIKSTETGVVWLRTVSALIVQMGTKKSCCLGDRLVILQSKTFPSQIIALGGGLSCEALLFLG